MENIDKENMDFYCNRIFNNNSIQISNSKIWTYFLDNKLRDFVIEYNFNFADIANRFQEFIAYPYKYDFTEEEIRKHWAFLHSCRYLNKDIYEDFYDSQKANYNQLAEEEENLIIQEKIDFEKEQKEQEKLRREKDQKYINENNKVVKVNKLNQESSLINDKEKNQENKNDLIKSNKINKDEVDDEIVNTNINKVNKNHQEIKKDSLINNNNNNKNLNLNVINNPDTSKKIKQNKDITDDIISSKENFEIKKIIQKEKENLEDELSLNNEDIINALFKKANEIKLDYGDLNLTIPGKNYILPEVDKQAWDDFHSDFKILPDHGLTEEDKIKRREDMLKEFKEEEIRKKKLLKNNNDNSIDNYNNNNNNEILEAYFNINQKSMRFFTSKIEGDLNNLEIISKIFLFK